MNIVNAIAGYIGLDCDSVTSIASRAPSLYRRYLVPKKRGGLREIFHPAKEIKALQMAAIDLLYRPEMQHEAAYGYVRGLKAPLRQAATVHAKNPFLLKLDFSDFFPSIHPVDFEVLCVPRLLVHGYTLSPSDINFLIRLFFVTLPKRGSFLAIGAPSSPFISNWVMYDLDLLIADLSKRWGCAYTRYADDICISSCTVDRLLHMETAIRDAVSKATNPRLVFNEKKRRLASPWSRRCVTGLVVTPRGEVKVPRQTKRTVRSLLHKFNASTIKTEDGRRLTGFLGFINDCEPEYIHNLAMKYGADVIARARKR